MNNAIITLDNVSRSYDSGVTRVLDSVSLSIAEGESVALAGPSGSGKSTLLNIIGTLDFACSGNLTVAGSAIAKGKSWELFRNRTIGFVFQLFHLIPDLTLLENVETALAPRRLPRSEARERARACLDQVGLSARESSLPATVSGGERQRAAIARALVADPQIILADEPTGNLDSKAGGKILDLLQEQTSARQTTLIMVTHNPEFAARMGRTLHLHDGRLIA